MARAKVLQGHDCLFTQDDPLYMDKARRFPGRSFLVGADALARLLDLRWGHEVEPMLEEFARLGTTFRVNGRLVDGEYLTPEALIARVPARFHALFVPVAGRWDLSSTDVRCA